MGWILLGKIPYPHHLWWNQADYSEFLRPGKTGFMQVVMCNTAKVYIRSVLWQTAYRRTQKTVNVFVPNSPNPMTGFLHISTMLMLSARVLPWRRAEDGVSAGRMSPKDVGIRWSRQRMTIPKNKTSGVPIGEKWKIKLYRSRKDRMLFGYARAGKFFGIDSTIIDRFCLLAFTGFGILAISSSQ